MNSGFYMKALEACANEEYKTICRIKCPINPLPIKGEFETPSVGAVSHVLATMGWVFKEKLHLNLLK